MTSYYESATSGLNHDRFPPGAGGSSTTNGVGGDATTPPIAAAAPLDDIFGAVGESTLVKMKQHFWTAKHLVRSKVLGKKEDEHLCAADADFDAAVHCYAEVAETTRRLLVAIDDYHHYASELLDAERDLSDFLRSELRNEKPHLADVMRHSANALAEAAKQRNPILRPLIRLYYDLDVFNERAVADCRATVEAAERARMEYRGALLWIKSASEELDDPSCGSQMERFRTAQAVVRQKKERFDALKADTEHKATVLAASRTRVIADLARQLSATIERCYCASAHAYAAAVAEMRGVETYEIDVLKILNDPVGLALERQKEERRRAQAAADRKKGQHSRRKRNDVPSTEASSGASSSFGGGPAADDDENLVELDDIEMGEVAIPADERGKQSGSGGGFDGQYHPKHLHQELISLDDDDSKSDVGGRGAENDVKRPSEGSQISPVENLFDFHQHRRLDKRKGGPAADDIFRVESPLGILNDEDESSRMVSAPSVDLPIVASGRSAATGDAEFCKIFAEISGLGGESARNESGSSSNDRSVTKSSSGLRVSAKNAMFDLLGEADNASTSASSSTTKPEAPPRLPPPFAAPNESASGDLLTADDDPSSASTSIWNPFPTIDAAANSSLPQPSALPPSAVPPDWSTLFLADELEEALRLSGGGHSAGRI